jgi:protein involved in polysaccharide export with SLBB domain
MLALLLLALSFAGDVPAHSTGLISVSPHYQVSPGDVLTLEVFGEPDMSRDLRVSQKGTIAVPYVGNLQAVGLTLDQLEAEVVENLGRSVLVNPQVTLGVRSYGNAVQVTGQVRAVGFYPITDSGMTVQPGDVIMVPAPPTVQVMGEVKDPQLVAYKAHLSVTDAIADAGGLTPIANKRVILLSRSPTCALTDPPIPPDGKAIRVDYLRIRNHQDADPELCPDDRIEVQQSAF